MNQQPQKIPDQLYQSFNRSLYRITGTEEEDDIMNMMQPNAGANNSGSVQTSASDIGSGTSTTITPQATGSEQSGKQTFDDPQAGYILGFDPKDGKAKFSIGDATHYIKWDGTSFTVLGAVSVSQLDIPDTTTASSFHTDSSGNSWWGANVASGYANANASILATGAATFKNVSIGGAAVQYVITNSGIFSYGDGSDGTATCDGSTAVAGMSLAGSTYTLTRDVYFTNLTVNVGVIVTGQYRIFCSVSLSVSGTIHNNGNAGGTGVQFGGNTTGGAAVPAGYFLASAIGGNGTGNTGDVGGNCANALGGNGGSGGGGGSGSLGSHGNGASGGTATASNVRLIANWHLATLLDITAAGTTAKFTSGGGGGAGGKGGDFPSNDPAGAGGSAAGIVAVYARSLTISATGVISANGGAGGGGSNATSSNGSGGGGGGGAGGIVVLTYNQLSNSGSITANAGAAGAGGVGGNQNGGAGSAGSAGSIYQFQLSL